MSHFRKRFHKPGTSPGTLNPHEVHAGVGKVTLSLIDYGPDRMEEKEVRSIEETFPYRDESTVTWIHVTGLHDVELLQRLGEHFGLHPLALEDVLNTGQRPKIEDYEGHRFIVMRELHWDGSVETEQVSLFLAKNCLITIQEAAGDLFESVRERLRKGKGRIRKMGADYLAYALMDALVDGFFPVLEKFGERIEELEEAVVTTPSRETLQDIRALRRDLLVLRRTAWPQREVVNGMQREDSPLIRKETRPYLRDLYDHTIQIMDMIETYRELAAGMLEVYLSSVSNRLNEVIKVLTMVATIFIPLTFIVGVYGMNFNTEVSPWNMPELNWYYGYPVVLLCMLAMAIGMLVYFRRKNWL